MNIIKSDIILYLKKTNETFDIIFSDPPYDVKFHDQIAEIVFERNLLREDGVLIVEHGKQTDFNYQFTSIHSGCNRRNITKNNALSVL